MDYSPETEAAIVGSLIKTPGFISRVRAQIEPSFISDGTYNGLYVLLIDMSRYEKPITIVTVLSEARRVGISVTKDDIVKLVQVATEEVKKLDGFCWYVRELNARRTLREELSEHMNTLSTTARVDEIAFSLSEKCKGLMSFVNCSTAKFTKNLIDDEIQKIRNVIDTGVSPGLMSGLKDVDDLSQGFLPGDLFLFAARPSVGKTALALNVVNNILGHDNEKEVLFFSAEMTSSELLLRLLAMRSGIEGAKIRRGKVDNNDFRKLKQSASELRNFKLAINDHGEMSIGRLSSIAMRHADVHPKLSLIIVDYIQLLSGPDYTKKQNRTTEVSAISSGLKGLAKNLGVPVLALSQLSRDIERREKGERIPRLSDLRDSGSLEQDADKVLFVHRQKESEGDDPMQPVDAWLLLQKHRNGRTGKVMTRFTPGTTMFSDVPRVAWKEL